MPKEIRYKKAKTQLGKNGFVYKPQYGVIVVVKNEQEQAALFADLKAMQRGTVKVVSV